MKTRLLTPEPAEAWIQEAPLTSQMAACTRPRAFRAFSWSSQDMAASSSSSLYSSLVRLLPRPELLPSSSSMN